MQDVPQILELLDLVFRPTMDRESRRLLHTSLSLRHSSWLLMRLNQVNSGLVPGFVWEENGKIVGNVSLLTPRTSDRYLVANVAVHPSYRRRGIARQLMLAVLARVRAHQGRTVLLQVESSNESAIHLYESLGFYTVGSTHSWRATPSQIRLISPGEAPISIRPLRRHEWRTAFALDCGTQHPDLTWPDPPAPDSYQLGLRHWLGQFISGRQKETWVTDGEREIMGLASIDSEWGRAHWLTLRCRPSHARELARPLLAKLLRRLEYLTRRRVRIDHLAGDELVGHLLKEANFQVQRTLTTMRLDLDRS